MTIQTPKSNIDYLLVVDFEATCCNKKTITKEEVEIIEIGAILVEWPTLDIKEHYQSFIRPVKTRILTPFCTKLTGIKQEQVDNAPEFPTMIKEIQSLFLKDRTVIFCCWSPFDWRQLHRDCTFHNINNPFSHGQWDLQRLFRLNQKKSQNMSLSRALTFVDVAPQGMRHSGYYDALNTANLLPWCIPDSWRKIPTSEK
jgi:inhibitor of KinA sporulation pathway (predicted exonuclease)